MRRAFLYSAVLSILATVSAAQRPADTSICDYYTPAIFGSNTADNQHAFITRLVHTAVIGNYTKPNVGIKVTGFLNPGVYDGQQVNLLPYFNGCLNSTNRNNETVSLSFLDGGAADALKQDLPAFDTTTNQYHLFIHLYQFFAKFLGCSGYGTSSIPAYEGNPSMFDVHKYMNLDTNELGWHNYQIGLSAASLGASADDAHTVFVLLTQYFGYRCTPRQEITGGLELQSVCTKDTCLPDPHAQCDVYPYPDGVTSEPEPAPQCLNGTPTSTLPTSIPSQYPSATHPANKQPSSETTAPACHA